MFCGQPYELFWEVTLGEVEMIVDGCNKRIRFDHNERMRAAWHVEAFARTKRLPKLKDVLLKDQPTNQKRMTTDQLIAVTKAWMASTQTRR